MLHISANVKIPAAEIQIRAVLAQGAGGQNVNKVASAIHLRFDIRASSLPAFYKERLLKCPDRRITREGVVVIKAQQSRSQEQNREAALQRLQKLIQGAAVSPKKRRPTRPSRRARERRLDRKNKRGRLKSLRSRVDE